MNQYVFSPCSFTELLSLFLEGVYVLNVHTALQINDRYEFPLQLDLDRENGKYLSPDADRGVRNLYTLHRYANC